MNGIPTLEQLLGLSEYPAHELPWAAPLDVPEYTAYKHGEWELIHGKMPKSVRGYYSGTVNPEHPTNPVLKRGEDVWMSITPMELESQAPHAHFATGHTVICGLGMGVVLYNILKNPNVTEVTVIEQSQDVIDMFYEIADACKWEGYEKLNPFICADATKVHLVADIDFLCSDIAQSLGESNNFDILKQINENNTPNLIAQWGGEFDFVEWCMNNGKSPSHADDFDYELFKRESGMPLICWEGVAQYCLHVVSQTVLL